MHNLLEPRVCSLTYFLVFSSNYILIGDKSSLGDFQLKNNPRVVKNTIIWMVFLSFIFGGFRFSCSHAMTISVSEEKLKKVKAKALLKEEYTTPRKLASFLELTLQPALYFCCWNLSECIMFDQWTELEANRYSTFLEMDAASRSIKYFIVMEMMIEKMKIWK